MRGNRCEVYINDVKSKLFPLGSSGCRSNLPAALFGMTVSINEAGKEKENITKQRDSKKGGIILQFVNVKTKIDIEIKYVAN